MPNCSVPPRRSNSIGTPLSMLRPICGCGPLGLMKSSVVEKFGKSDFEVDSATSARILSLSVTCQSVPKSNTRLLVTRAPVSLDVRIFGSITVPVLPPIPSVPATVASTLPRSIGPSGPSSVPQLTVSNALLSVASTTDGVAVPEICTRWLCCPRVWLLSVASK